MNRFARMALCTSMLAALGATAPEVHKIPPEQGGPDGSSKGAVSAPDGKTRAKRGTSALFLANDKVLRTNSSSSAPLDAAQVARNLSDYDAIWCAQLIAERNRLAWNYLRKEAPGILMLHYMAADSSRLSGETAYFDYDYITKNHPEWFLLKDARHVAPADYLDEDKRIRWDPSDPRGSYYRRFYLDIGNKEFQQWAASEAVAYVSGKRRNLDYAYDGLGFDNVHIGAMSWAGLNKRCPDFKYAGNPDAWNNAFLEYLGVVKEALGKRNARLVVNHNLDCGTTDDEVYWNRLYACVDGVMSERALSRKAGESWYTGQKWLTAIARHEQAVSKGLIDWWVIHPEKRGSKGYTGFWYCYGSWLLVKEPGLSYFYAQGLVPGGEPWYAEYDLAIGSPSAKRYEKDGCWWREYERATVVVNPTAAPVAISLPAPMRDAANSEIISKTTLAAQDALILLKQ